MTVDMDEPQTFHYNEAALRKMPLEELRIMTSYINLQGQQESARISLPENKPFAPRMQMRLRFLEQAQGAIASELDRRAEGFFNLIFGGARQ